MTQEQKAAAWDKLSGMMTADMRDGVVIRDAIRKRGMFWMFSDWVVIDETRPFGKYLYEGPDPIAALEALTK